ncbi:hypothetical protein SFA35_10050 [Pseudomonas sp. HR96]|uniref:hypothetical protein n=1 Tax=Pseudomonas sp. HR96 TaxID=1027966 RepID=UPI002A75F625|nr:hypothetical protein [Pseudomonas sp. HR96]WPP01657.1 hypothetical protein SFA35_10050 [Pseudomonas sp. HR96]
MKARMAAALMMIAGAACADDLKPFKFEVDPPPAQVSAAPICGFENFTAPADLVVYAAGGYSGREVGFQIDQSGNQATQFDIAVNSPDKPVALILGAYDPTVWNIGWTPGTRIVAVYVSGYNRQVLAGLDSTVPVLNSSYENKGPCGYSYVSRDSTVGLNPLSRRLFGQPVSMVYPGDKSGKILIGSPLGPNPRLVTSSAVTPDSLRDKQGPLAGQAGIDEAVRNGSLRAATRDDVQAWVDARAAATPAERDVPPVAGGAAARPLPSVSGAYVVLKAFTFPAGLYGGHAVTFYVPRGVPLPTGQRGHSAVYDFNSLHCEGPLCR